jgi:hypothetical protein
MEPLWINDPSILFSRNTWYKFVPMSYMDIPTSLNAIVRFTTYFSIIMAMSDSKYLIAIPVVLVLTVLAEKVFPQVRTLEAFKAATSILENLTHPSPTNPFMNPLLTEIQDNPNRADAAPITSNKVKREIEKAFQHTSDIYMDTSDRFDMAQSMKTFHTLQSAKIPNDQDGFLKFLSKGIDEPDFSSAFPSRNAKEKSESYVVALGSAGFTGSSSLPNSTTKPAGTTPAKNL